MTKRIAWIEDDAYIIRNAVRPLEEDHGIEISIFETMKDVLDQIETIKKCDLIILDVIIPSGIVDDTNYNFHIGVRLLQKLREMGILIPVIAFTVIRNKKILKQLKDLNVITIINKPALPSELEKAVITILGE